MANGIFAMSELALVAARKIRLQQLAEAGDAKAQTALNLAKYPNQFLATVQMGITLVGIMAGAFGGKNYMERFEKWLTRIQDENLMVVGAMTDPKGDRSKPLQINRIQINMFISLRVKMTALLFLVRNFT